MLYANIAYLAMITSVNAISLYHHIIHTYDKKIQCKQLGARLLQKNCFQYASFGNRPTWSYFAIVGS